MAVAADTNDKVLGPEESGTIRVDVFVGDDNVSFFPLCRHIKFTWQNTHFYISVERKRATIDELTAGGSELLLIFNMQTLSAGPEVQGDEVEGI